MGYYIEAVVPDEEDTPDIHVGYDLATGRWEVIGQPVDQEYAQVVCELLDTYMEEKMSGEHHFGDPRLWRALSGVSDLEGRITLAPEIPPLPPGCVS